MKRGAKRPAMSDFSDSALASKRVMEAPSFDVHRAESSRQHLMAGPPLDVQRAESSRQHVRALNAQFASWVQSQIQNHPDELWEDGVKDYLSHASHIMEKFKDVVDWLRANAANSASISTAGSPSDQNNLVAVMENNKPNLHPIIKSGFMQEGRPASFSSSQSLHLFSNHQTPAFPGSQNSTPPKFEASDVPDEENDLEQPSSPSLKKTEEKGIVVVHEAKCKVYIKPDNPADKGWKDMGMGQLSIKCKEGVSKATKESKPTIVIRNDVGKILLNALIYPSIKMNIQKKTIATIFHTSGGGHANGVEPGNNDIAVARTYLLRMKTEEETMNLAGAIKEYAPAA